MERDYEALLADALDDEPAPGEVDAAVAALVDSHHLTAPATAEVEEGEE